MAGAVATGTHGSGDRNQSLSAAVSRLEVVGPDGTLRTLERGDADLVGSVVALGALGVVVRLDLDVVPTYLLRQEVRTGLRWAAVERDLDAITGAGYSVSMFTHLDDEEVAQLWVKSDADAPPLSEAVGLVGTVAAPETRHMLRGVAVDAVNRAGRRAGPVARPAPALPDGAHAEQRRGAAERVVRRAARRGPGDARVCARRWRRTAAWCRSRRSAPSPPTTSGSAGPTSATASAFHMTWVRDEPAVRAACRAVEAALAPYAARPHWGKVFETPARSCCGSTRGCATSPPCASGSTPTTSSGTRSWTGSFPACAEAPLRHPEV